MAARRDLTRYNYGVRARVLATAIGLLGLLGLLVGACKDDGSSGSDDGDSSGGPVDLEAPDFLEPAGGELHVSVMQFDDLELDVAIAAGATELQIDGMSLGTLSSPNAVGALTADLLRLHVTGGLVPSVHALQMRTYDPVETELSELVDVFLDPEPAPEIEVTLADSVVATGDAIVAIGPGDRGVLAIVDGTTSTATLFATEAAGWDTTASHELALPGYTTALGDRSPAIAIERDPDDPAAMLVAWRVGHPGTRIDAIAARWGGEASSPRTALSLDPAWIGSFETAAFGAPAIAGALLLAELEAHADAEQPRQGDRALAMVRLAADATAGNPARAQLSAPTDPTASQEVPGLVDVEGLVPALDPAGASAGLSVALGVRLAGRPAVLDVDRSSRTLAVRSSTTADSFGALDDLDGPLATLLGAFGSRIVAGATTDPVVALALVDDRGVAGLNDASIDPDDVDLGVPSGPPVLGLLGGAAIVVVPFGVDAPLLVALVVAADPTIVVVPDIGCDAVALPQTAAGNAGGALAFACLQDRELRVGTVALR